MPAPLICLPLGPANVDRMRALDPALEAGGQHRQPGRGGKEAHGITRPGQSHLPPFSSLRFVIARSACGAAPLGRTPPHWSMRPWIAAPLAACPVTLDELSGDEA